MAGFYFVLGLVGGGEGDRLAGLWFGGVPVLADEVGEGGGDLALGGGGEVGAGAGGGDAGAEEAEKDEA